MIENKELFHIYAVPYSMEAYNTFYKSHADLVILDTSIFLSYENLIKQLKQCQWHYDLVLLTDASSSLPVFKNLLTLSKSSITKEVFYDLLSQIITAKITSYKESTNLSFE